jgi:glycosyltransferase involved in cell wall biosynthesis
MVPLLALDEHLTVLYDPAYPIALPPSDVVHTIPLAASPFSLRQQWIVSRLLRDLRPNASSHREAAFSSVIYHSPYIAMPYLPGVPALLTVYDLIPLRYPEHSTPRARLFVRWMTRLALRAARHVIAISEFTRRDYLAEFALSPERISAIPLAADPAFSPQPPEALAAVRQRYSLPAQYVLYLGSNKPHKNLTRLVEAWHVANGEWQMAPSGGRWQTPGLRFGASAGVENCRLVIAGAWDARYPEARQRAEVLGLADSVQWLGPVPEADLPALYAAAMAFVFPSLYEGFGLPVLEAMACGTPVICSNTSSLPEVAGQPMETQRKTAPHTRRKDAKTLLDPESSQSDKSGRSAPYSPEPSAALLVDPTDTDALAAAIVRLITDETLRQDMAQRGLAQAARFSWERTATATLEIYRRLAAEKP